MKVLLVTIAIGEKYLKGYMDTFHESQKKYALRHGYDFKVITEFLDPVFQIRQTISFNKILVCSQEWSAAYDFIIFIDADIVINKNAPALHNYIDYGTCIGVVDEWSQPSKERRLKIQKQQGWEVYATDNYKLCGFDIETDVVFNSGILVMQPNIHAEFLKNIYDTYIIKSVSHYRGFIFEQTCIGYELQKANMYKILDNRFNALWGLAKLDNTENFTFNTFYDTNFFMHLAGSVDHDKVKELEI